MCSSFVNWTWRWLALTSNVEGSSVSVSAHGLPSVRSSTPALADALGSGTMEMGRKRRHPTSGPRCTLNAIYQFWPRVRESTSQIKSWVRAAGCISACLIAWQVTWQQCGPRLEWVNGYGNRSHTSIQVICGRVWNESRFSGVSLIILCYRHIYDKRSKKKKKKSSAAFKQK